MLLFNTLFTLAMFGLFAMVSNRDVPSGQESYRLKRALLTAAAMLCVSCLAYYAAFMLRFAGRIDEVSWNVFLQTIAIVLAVRLGTALWLREWQEWNRFYSFGDLLSLVKTLTIGTVGIILADAFLMPQVTIPRSVLLLDWGTTLVSLAAINCLPRLIHDLQWFSKSETSQQISALIVGANDAGEGLLRSINRSNALRYKLVGFVDERPRYRGRQIGGIPVLGEINDVPTLAKQHKIQQVLLTAGDLPGKQVRQLVDLSRQEGFEVRVLPSYEQILNENVSIKPRDVVISDLLRRPPVKLNNQEINDWIVGRTVMVTGSSGSIGSEIAQQLLKLRPSKVVLVDRSETGQFFLERDLANISPEIEREVILADLTDRSRLEAVFVETQPDVIFHAAAYKHVPLMEKHPGEAVKNIVLATRNIVDLAEDYGVEGFVMVSTDKAVNPTSVMGACKRVAEQYVQARAVGSNCRLVTVRFGNVLDSAGSVVPIFRKQIAEGGPLTVTHPEMVRFFMLIPEAAQLVIQAGAMGNGGEIFVLDMGEPVRVMDLARDMIRLSGLREGEDIEIDITGLRPGEKLYEELYGENEKHQPTNHKKIMVAASMPRSLPAMIAATNQLIDAANTSVEDVRQILRDNVQHAAEPAAVLHSKAA